MELLFLGTGGGRFNLLAQLRRTAGFLLLGSLNMHVDPGPGSLAACKAYGYSPLKTDAVVVTHNHIDHVNDAQLMMEAMTGHGMRKRGMLISSKSVSEKDEYGEKGVSSYYLEKLQANFVARHGEPILLGKGGRKARLLPVRTKHEDSTGFGFVLEMDGARIGYTSDTEYFEGIWEAYTGCDLLIANNLKQGEDGVPGHLHSATTSRLLSECKPRLAIITHLGQSLIKSGPEKEAKKISRDSGVNAIAAEDGMRISFPSLAVIRKSGPSAGKAKAPRNKGKH